MIQTFNIVRDLNKYAYKKGSERIVVTQFDTGIRLNFELLSKKEPVDLQGHRAFVSFFNEKEQLLLTEECASIQDLSLNPRFALFYLMDERLTSEAGQLTAIVDVVDPEGFRTAIRPFSITILPHLLKEPVSIPDIPSAPEEVEPPQPSDPSDNPTLPEEAEQPELT